MIYFPSWRMWPLYLRRGICLIFVVLGFVQVRAQDFPWGKDNPKNVDPPTYNPATSNPPADTATKARPSLPSNPTLADITSNLAERFPKFKPGMSRFHELNFGKKINFDSLYKIDGRPLRSKTHGCTRSSWVVYGFHPSWMGSAWNSYNFKVLSHVAYFCYQVDLKTGAPSDLGDWATTSMVQTAQAAGCKVHLTVTTVGSNGRSRDMLNNPQIAQTCIDSLAYWVKKRNADGVCIDFEDMGSQDTTAFVNWVIKLQTRLRKDNPKAEIAIAGNASGEASIFNLPKLDAIIDYMVIMGYDYTYSGSPNAGCTAPLQGPTSGINLEWTIDGYLKGGIRASHLVLALPYYGDQWVTKGPDGTSPANTAKVSFEGAVTYKQLMTSVIKDYQSYYDTNSRSSYYVKPDGSNYMQAWVIDSVSMSYRFNMVKEKKIAGVGIWALGYDNGQTAMWNLLNTAFGACDSATMSLSLPHRKPSGEREGGGWLSTNHWELTTLCLIGLLILGIILWIDPKAREEVMNRYLLFPLGAFVAMVACLLLYEYIHDYLEWMSPRFPWIIVTGTGILIVGYYFGRIWTEKRNEDRK